MRLLEEGKTSVADLAVELAIRRNQLYMWKEEIHRHTVDACPKSGRRRPTAEYQAEEIAAHCYHVIA